jgi:hypothetical protein
MICPPWLVRAATTCSQASTPIRYSGSVHTAREDAFWKDGVDGGKRRHHPGYRDLFLHAFFFGRLPDYPALLTSAFVRTLEMLTCSAQGISDSKTLSDTLDGALASGRFSELQAALSAYDASNLFGIRQGRSTAEREARSSGGQSYRDGDADRTEWQPSRCTQGFRNASGGRSNQQGQPQERSRGAENYYTKRRT